MRIVDKARTLETKIARAFSRAAETAVGSSALEPLEVVYAVVDDVERQVQPGGRGARIFPFNSVVISVLAPSRDARMRFDAVVEGDPTLRARVAERLQSGGCETTDLCVEIVYATRATPSWKHAQFHVAYDRVAPRPPAVPVEPAPARVEITVLRGTAEQRTYTLAARRIDFGRGIEVRDDRNRLLRTNHVAFIEGLPGENQTVSRRHAHVTYDAVSREHRLRDDGSAHGSGILRDGRTIPVPAGSRGVRLRSGDEIVLGEARARIRIETPIECDITTKSR
jgi:hypothetical protein